MLSWGLRVPETPNIRLSYQSPKAGTWSRFWDAGLLAAHPQDLKFIGLQICTVGTYRDMRLQVCRDTP